MATSVGHSASVMRMRFGRTTPEAVVAHRDVGNQRGSLRDTSVEPLPNFSLPLTIPGCLCLNTNGHKSAANWKNGPVSVPFERDTSRAAFLAGNHSKISAVSLQDHIRRNVPSSSGS